jgi:hypothetical protein
MFIDRLVAAGGAIAPSVATGYVVAFDPEIYKQTLLASLDTAGVKYLFHSYATQFYKTEQNPGVIFATKSGDVLVSAKVIIDCTGDGDIAVSAGAEYEIGRQEDGLVQPMTLMFRIIGFQKDRFEKYVHKHPDQWQGVSGLQELVQKAKKAGELDLQRENILFFATPHEHEISVNSTRILNVLGTDVWDWSYAEREGMQQMRQIEKFLKKYVPGFENSYVVQSGVHACVRETRRIIGEYKITADDILSARKFDDMIACASYPIDIHNPKGKGTMLKNLPPQQWYSIPLRCLVPKKVEHILTAGRCISGTHVAFASYRVMPISMATGQAAGVCAAIGVKKNILPRDVSSIDVQNELLKQGAILEK